MYIFYCNIFFLILLQPLFLMTYAHQWCNYELESWDWEYMIVSVIHLRKRCFTFSFYYVTFTEFNFEKRLQI